MLPLSSAKTLRPVAFGLGLAFTLASDLCPNPAVASPPVPDFQFKKIVDTSSAIPEGLGNFTAFLSSVVAGGDIAFLASGVNDQQGLYLSHANQLVRIADLETIPPDAFVPFDSFADYPFTVAGGSVFFTGFW